MKIIRQKYEGQLDDLIKELRRLGLRVYSNVNNAIESLSEDDRNFARHVIEKDKEILEKKHHKTQNNLGKMREDST